MISSEDLCEKKRRKQKQCSCELTENREYVANKLVMISPVKNYDFWLVDRLVSYLSNVFRIALIQVLWTKLWSFYEDCVCQTKTSILMF